MAEPADGVSYYAIGDRDVLLVKRFDREKTENGYTRARMISALTFLQTEDTHQSRDKWSYILLVGRVAPCQRGGSKRCTGIVPPHVFQCTYLE